MIDLLKEKNKKLKVQLLRHYSKGNNTKHLMQFIIPFPITELTANSTSGNPVDQSAACLAYNCIALLSRFEGANN